VAFDLVEPDLGELTFQEEHMYAQPP